MSISPDKKEFLCYIVGGLSTLMNCSMLADEIYTTYRMHGSCVDDDIYTPDPDPTELYINDNILDGSSFSENKFCKAMDTIDDGTLWELLTYFDSRDMNISQVYIESCLVPSDLPEELKKFTESIDYKEIQTFADFLEL